MVEPKILFTRKFIPPAVYREALTALLGPEWLGWTPETIWSHVEDLGVGVTDWVRDKINALQTLLTTQDFWNNYFLFEKIVLAFNDRMVDPEHVQVCLPEELAYGLTVAGRIKEKPFDPEIVHYVRGCCEQAGLAVYHRSFRFAEPTYEREDLRRLVSEVRRVWDVERFTQIRIPPEREHDPVMAQVGRLHDIEVYVVERLEKGREAIMEGAAR